MALLSVNNLSISFGGLKAVSDLNLSLEQGDLAGLIGPNGAGKTTAFNMLTGVYLPTSGDILLDGKSLVGLKPYQINHRGVARTFQNIRLFSDLTVIDNLKIAYHSHAKYGLLGAIARLPGFYSGEKEMHDKSMELLKIFKLDNKAEGLAKNLPYGEQSVLKLPGPWPLSPGSAIR
ncbi:hypothetical protein N752_14440 [Desulforamulus aquiferis]|nr:hypothetical protein N752_14440 [Desulforamulus aquiferis]